MEKHRIPRKRKKKLKKIGQIFVDACKLSYQCGHNVGFGFIKWAFELQIFAYDKKDDKILYSSSAIKGFGENKLPPGSLVFYKWKYSKI